MIIIVNESYHFRPMNLEYHQCISEKQLWK